MGMPGVDANAKDADMGVPGSAEKSSSTGGGDDTTEFGGAMAMAQMLSSAAQQAQKPEAKQSLGGDQLQLSGSSVKKEQATREAGKFDKAAPRSPMLNQETGALIQRMSVGSNTAAEIAGLKPWSKEWVMEGNMRGRPEQKTLFGGDQRGESADAEAKLADLVRLMKASTEQTRGSEMKVPAAQGLLKQQLQGPAAVSHLPQAEMLDVSGEAIQEPATFEGSYEEAAPVAHKKQMSGDDFLSIRQGKNPEPLTLTRGMDTSTVSGAPTLTGSKNLKLVNGGFEQAAGKGIGSRPGDLAKDLDSSSSSTSVSPGVKDTLGLIHPEMNAKAGVSLNRSALPFAASAGTLQLNASVVPGTLQRNRFSSESVAGVSQGIRELKASGGGEMRLRLKPDHLGEIHLKVVTGGRTGSEVGLQIQASDDRAKKILEESMGSLKESLAGHNLTLSKVDVQIATSNNQDGQSSPNFSSQGNQNEMTGRSFSQGGQKESANTDSGRLDGLRSSIPKTASQAFTGSARSASAGSGRLDVMA